MHEKIPIFYIITIQEFSSVCNNYYFHFLRNDNAKKTLKVKSFYESALMLGFLCMMNSGATNQYSEKLLKNFHYSWYIEKTAFKK